MLPASARYGAPVGRYRARNVAVAVTADGHLVAPAGQTHPCPVEWDTEPPILQREDAHPRRPVERLYVESVGDVWLDGRRIEGPVIRFVVTVFR